MVAQETEVIGCTGAWLSSFTLAVTEVTERAELPCLTLSYSDQITARGFHYIFQTSPTGDEQAKQALPTIIQLAQAATGTCAEERSDPAGQYSSCRELRQANA